MYKQIYKDIVNLSQDGIWVYDKDNVIIFVNDSLCKMLNYTQEEMLGTEIFKYVPFNKTDFVLNEIENRKKGIIGKYDSQIITKEGKSISISVKSSPMIKDDEYEGVISILSDITDRLIIQEKFQKSFEQSPVAKAISEFETGKYIDVNTSFLRLLGLNKKDIIGKTSLELNLFDSYTRKNMLDTINEIGYIQNEELIISRPDGEKRVGLFSGDVIYIQNEKCLITVFNDITEIKNLEDDLMESEMKFKNIFNESPIGIALYDENGILHEMNQSFTDIFGIKTLKNLKYLNLFHQPNGEEIKRELEDKKIWQGEIDFDFDTMKSYGRFKSSRSGKLRFDIIIVKYRFNGSSYMVMVQDVTQHYNQLNLIKENEEKFRNVFYKSPIAIELYNNEGDLIEVNDECIDMFGVVDENELKKFNMFLDPNLPKNVKEILEQDGKWEGESLFDFDLVIKNKLYKTSKQGKIYLYISIVRQEKSENTRYIVQIQDITEYKEYTEKLKMLNETKDKFFSIVSHDLTSPFRSILSFSEVLYDDYFSYTDEERIQNIKYIKDASKNALDLLQNLLDWSLSQDEKIKYTPKSIDVSIPINDTIKLLSSQSIIKDIKLISRVPYHTYCYTDVNMLKTILRNLISNAIKFTHDGGEIEITSEKIIHRNKPFIKINVHDNGIGIKKENICKLFKIEEKFKSFGTHKENGAGLGLIICKDFTRMMGGRLLVQSEFGKGSIFSFTLAESIDII